MRCGSRLFSIRVRCAHSKRVLTVVGAMFNMRQRAGYFGREMQTAGVECCSRSAAACCNEAGRVQHQECGQDGVRHVAPPGLLQGAAGVASDSSAPVMTAARRPPRQPGRQPTQFTVVKNDVRRTVCCVHLCLTHTTKAWEHPRMCQGPPPHGCGASSVCIGQCLFSITTRKPVV